MPPKLDLAVDMGHPFSTASSGSAPRWCLQGRCRGDLRVPPQRDVSKHKGEDALKKMCKEGACWGTIAGVYVGVEYGIEKIRGRRDWKNATLGGAVTGALVSAVCKDQRQNLAKNVITGGAIATAAEFISHLT
ncbi:hypothetical protein ACP70R_039080 [Stipagrostis hirtigluma subsp. patula]